MIFFFFKQKTAYEMRISDWSSDVCSSDLPPFDTGSAYQIGVEMQGRLRTPEQFADVVVRTDPDGRQVRVRDVARVELGAQDYATNTYLSGKPTVVIAVLQLPGSNALDRKSVV